MKIKERLLTYILVALFVGVPLVWAGVTNFDAIKVIAKSGDTYQIEVDNSSGTRVFSVDSSGNVYTGGAVTGQAYAIATHSYTAAETWTLSAAEEAKTILVVSSGSGSPKIYPSGTTTCTDGKFYIVRNAAKVNVVLKTSDGTGVTIATSKTASAFGWGNDFYRMSADASN